MYNKKSLQWLVVDVHCINIFGGLVEITKTVGVDNYPKLAEENNRTHDNNSVAFFATTLITEFCPL